MHSIITIYPWMYNWRFWHFRWYFSGCDFLYNELFWVDFYLSPWQCFETVFFFYCAQVIIGLQNSVFFSPSNECIDCLKRMYYCAVRKYAEKYWSICQYFWSKNKSSLRIEIECWWWSVSFFCMWNLTERGIDPWPSHSIMQSIFRGKLNLDG